MFKNASSASITSFGTPGSVLRRNKIIECFCQDDSVLRIVTDVNNVNYGKKFGVVEIKKIIWTRGVISSSG